MQHFWRYQSTGHTWKLKTSLTKCGIRVAIEYFYITSKTPFQLGAKYSSQLTPLPKTTSIFRWNTQTTSNLCQESTARWAPFGLKWWNANLNNKKSSNLSNKYSFRTVQSDRTIQESRAITNKQMNLWMPWPKITSTLCSMCHKMIQDTSSNQPKKSK